MYYLRKRRKCDSQLDPAEEIIYMSKSFFYYPTCISCYCVTVTKIVGESHVQTNAGLVVTRDLHISTHASITKFTVFTSCHINTIKKCAKIQKPFEDIT